MSQFSGGGGAPPTPWYKENPVWGSVGGFWTFALAGVGFGLSGHLTLGRWLLAAAWPWGVMAIWCALNGLTNKRWIRMGGRVAAVTIVGLILAIGAVWMGKTKTPAATALNPAPGPQPPAPQAEPAKPQPSKPSDVDVGEFLFKDSPLFTPHRKQLIAKTFIAFKAYLIGVGLDVPKRFPPIGIETDKTSTSHFRYSSGPPYHDTVWMKMDQLDDPRMISQNYSGYVFSTLLMKPMIAKFQALPRDEPLDGEARRKVMQEDDSRWNAELAMFRYFTWSYWGKPENEQTACPYHQSMLFVSYLWRIRETYGKNFTDRLLAYTTREMIDNPPEPNEVFPIWFLRSISNADAVVDNKAEKIPAIRQVLNQCGWLEPSK